MKVRNRLYYPMLVGLGLMASLALSTTVNAQDEEASAQGEDFLEEVIVTGSRISRDGFASSSPLAVFDEADIALAGNSSIDEFLKYIPQFTGYQMGKSTNNGSDNGATKIDVRGLGFNRTLVLINGRRTIGDATGDGAVDINTIPEAMIKRVDVLTDGASSIYGSDAIAGVVNFILYDDFEGLRVTVNYGSAIEDWDASDYGISILGGVGSDKGNIVYSMSWDKQDEMLQGDREWAFDALYPQLQDDGTFLAVGSGSSNSRKIRTSAGNFIFDSALGEARPFEAGDVYNYATVNALTQPNERYQFATNGKINLSDTTQAFFEGMYTRRTSQQRLAPDASFRVISDNETPNDGLQYNDFVPANNPYNPFGSVNCANTIGLCNQDVNINRRFVESGGRLFAQKADQYRLVFGLNGEMNMFNWDVAYTWAETQTANETVNYGRFDRWAVAVDPVACAADGSCPGVLNPFGDFGSISPEQMDFLTTGSLKDLYNSTLSMFEVNLTGDMGELSGGNIGWAAGYAHRREAGSFSPDEFSAAGLTTGGAADPLDGRFSVNEIYGEMLFPITDALVADASFRWSDYDSVESAHLTWKLGADWEIFDGFRLRGTVGTGFRAPNIAELNTGGGGTFPLTNDPCEFGDRALDAGDISQNTWDNCQVLGADTSDAGEKGYAWQSYQEFASSPIPLEPEKSDTFTFGFVWDIDVSDGLRLSVDYWDIKVEDIIAYPDANAMFNVCVTSENMSSPACDAGWDPFYYPGEGPGDLYNTYGNLGTLETDGIDFVLDYNASFNNGLGFYTKASATYTNSFKSGANPGVAQVEQAGTADGFGVYPEWKATFDFGLTGSAWNADLIFRYIGESDDLWRPPSTTADAVAESIIYTDLVGTFYWNAMRITGGINNLFDEDPPYFHSAFNANTEPGMYDVIGRRLFVSASWEW